MEQEYRGEDHTGALTLAGQTVPKEATMRVGDLMTREVNTLTPTSSVQEAIALLAERRFHHLLVAEADGRLAGILSDRDVLRFLARRQDASTAKVAAIMNSTPVAVHPASSLADAIHLLVHHRFNSLPVVDENNHVCGILTTTDLLRILEVLQRWFDQWIGSAAEPRDI
jgi:CBS domain-containing protein